MTRKRIEHELSRSPAPSRPATAWWAWRWLALPCLLFLVALGSSGRAFSGGAGVAEAPPFDAAVFPGATRFGPLEGRPPAAAVYRDGTLVGYVFSTQAVVASVGYSGKPLDILVGLDLQGRITGAKILEHHEPILVIGVRNADLEAFVAQYRGRDIRSPVKVVRRRLRDEDTVDAVSGATISSVVMNDSILRAARAVARSRGILDDGSAGLDLDTYSVADWAALLAEGSIVRRRISVEEVERALRRYGAHYGPPGSGLAPKTTFLDLYVGLASPARIGRNLLGQRVYNRVMAQLSEGDHVVFVAARGLYSFKGTRYVRSGTFDRIQIVQGERTFKLTAQDHIRIDRLRIAGAPELREAALFVLRRKKGFDPARPWRIDLLVKGRREDGTPAFATLSLGYALPDRYRLAPAPAESSPAPLWQTVWQRRIGEVGVLGSALVVLSAILFFQDALARRRRLYNAVRYGFLVFTLVWLGWYAGGQLSVLNVLTFVDALMTSFRWDFFLLEPLIFILWGYVAVTLLFWGRGVFCGWLCPFGALQELVNKAGQLLRLPQVNPPFVLHERLWPIKYVAFLALFALSIGGIGFLHLGAEIEPFKTAIILTFDRSWPFVLYAGALLVGGLFVNRLFCRYLCPLGAALALPARMRMFEWLKRRWQCGLQCHICANRCPVQAIHPDGRINPNECIHCLSCQVLYYDDTTCPPLVERRKRKESKLTRRLIERYAAAEAAAEEKGR